MGLIYKIFEWELQVLFLMIFFSLKYYLKKCTGQKDIRKIFTTYTGTTGVIGFIYSSPQFFYGLAFVEICLSVGAFLENMLYPSMKSKISSQLNL